MTKAGPKEKLIKVDPGSNSPMVFIQIKEIRWLYIKTTKKRSVGQPRNFHCLYSYLRPTRKGKLFQKGILGFHLTKTTSVCYPCFLSLTCSMASVLIQAIGVTAQLAADTGFKLFCDCNMWVARLIHQDFLPSPQ